MTAEADWISRDEALAAVLESVRPIGFEEVAAEASLGRALARPLTARVDNPLWDNSAMDGFAVYARDVAGASVDSPVHLPVSDDVPAGQFPKGPLEPGTVARVMTGAPVPEGATGVIRVEHTDGGPDEGVTIYDDADRDRHIRRRAEDIEVGDELIPAGSEVTPASTALFAMNGVSTVTAGRRPRIGVIVNGDELVDVADFDQVLAGRRIANSNGPGLAAQIVEAGGTPVPLGIASDDPRSLERLILAGAECDGLVSAAGVSVGDHDYVKDVLDALGFERKFWRILMRPGSATLFGLLDDRPFWGVPGNPVSALVTFEVLARPGIRKMAGYNRTRRARIPCRLEETVRGPADVTSFLRVRVTGDDADEPTIRLSGPQGSGVLSSMVADALLELPVGVSELAAGELGVMTPFGRLDLV